MILERARHGDVEVVTWNDGENRFRLDSVAAWHATLDELEQATGPIALVVTGTGKFFSNGLDLEAMAADAHAADDIVRGIHRLFGRMLTLDMYTVAALNGHVFAGGAMLACGFDARVMRADRGYWCLPEVDLGIPLTEQMFATVSAKLPPATLHEAIVTGRRYTAPEALAAGIVNEIAADEALVARAVELAAPMAAKSRSVIGVHKHQMYGGVAALCGV